MTFTFVIPVFKTERLLGRCLGSLAAQTDRDFEVVVVDDASPEFRELDVDAAPNLRILHHDRNRGLLQARLTGLRAAKGDFVVALDSDDYVAPELVARLRREIAENPSVDVIVYQMLYDRGGRRQKTRIRYRDERFSGEEAVNRLFASRLPCGICGKAVRREVYLKAMDQLGVGPDFYLNSSEDLCQTFPVLVNARSVATLAYPGYLYWINPDSLTTTLDDPAKMRKAAENTHLVFTTLKDFVRRNHHGESLVQRLDRFAEPTLEWYLGCIRHLPEPAWRACAAELCKVFPPDLVARRAMTLIESSRTFRLGRLLTRWVPRSH